MPSFEKPQDRIRRLNQTLLSSQAKSEKLRQRAAELQLKTQFKRQEEQTRIREKSILSGKRYKEAERYAETPLEQRQTFRAIRQSQIAGDPQLQALLRNVEETGAAYRAANARPITSNIQAADPAAIAAAEAVPISAEETFATRGRAFDPERRGLLLPSEAEQASTQTASLAPLLRGPRFVPGFEEGLERTRQLPVVGEPVANAIDFATSPAGIAAGVAAPAITAQSLLGQTALGTVGAGAEELGAPRGTREALELTGAVAGPLAAPAVKAAGVTTGRNLATAARREGGYGGLLQSEAGGSKFKATKGGKTGTGATLQEALTDAETSGLQDEAFRELVGGKGFTPQLSRIDRAANVLKETLGVGVPEEAFASSVMRERRDLGRTVESLGNRLGAISEREVNAAFKRDPKGRIVDLPGAPTVQDVAAKLPQYDPLLTPYQRQVLGQLKEEVGIYDRALAEVGIEHGTRPDIVDGGFYLPRGRADVEGADLPLKVGAGGGKKGVKRGFERSAVFDSMAQGIDEGYQYAPFGEAMTAFGKDAGTRALEGHAVTLFKGAVDEAGQPLGRVLQASEGTRVTAEIAAKQVDDAKKAVSALQRAKRGESIPTGTVRVIERIAPLLKNVRETTRILVEDLIGAGVEAAKPNVRLKPVEAGTLKKLKKLLVEAIDEARANPQDAAAQKRARKLASQLGFAKYRYAQQAAGNPDFVEGYVIPKNAVKILVGERQKALDEMITAIRGVPYEAKTSTGRTVTRYRGGIVETLQQQAKEATGERAQAVVEAHRLGRGEGQIGFYGLQGMSFPDAVANAANKYLRAEGPITGAGGRASAINVAVNGLLRGIRATADASFMGIQGLLGAFHKPQSYARALEVATKSLNNRESLAAFIADFDKAAVAKGLPNSREWIKYGLRMGGADSEFMITGKGLGRLPGMIEGAPVVRHANRSFGYFGDTLRLDSAFGMAEATGAKTADDFAQIAESANLMTGWSKGKFLGDVGNLVQFAPRFFQSQLDLLANATTKGGIQGDQARRMLIKLLGGGTLLTVAANESLGNKGFDYLSPTKNGKLNPNFMRIRVGGQDISLFGPWDSLLRGIVETASGRPEYLLRSKASPTIALAWDAITGKTFTGEKFTPETFLRGLLPFSLSEIGNEPLTSTLIGTTGLKATPISLYEKRDAIAQGVFGKNYNQLDVDERQQLDARSDVQDLSSQIAERGAMREYDFNVAEAQIAEQLAPLRAEQEADDAAAASGAMDIGQWKDNQRVRGAQQAAVKDAIFNTLDVQFKDRPNETRPIKAALDKYFAVETDAYTDPRTREVDWGGFYNERDAALDTLSPEQRQAAMTEIEKNLTPFQREFREASRLLDTSPTKWRGLPEDVARDIGRFLGDVEDARDVWLREYGRDVSQQAAIDTLAKRQGHPANFVSWAKVIVAPSSNRAKNARNPDFKQFLIENEDTLRRFYPNLYTKDVLESAFEVAR